MTEDNIAPLNMVDNLNPPVGPVDNIVKEKQEFLEKLIDMYPFLEIEKQKIYNECMIENDNPTKQVNNKTKSTKRKKKSKKDEIILEQFKYNGKLYYKDNYKGILDETATLVGTIRGVDEKGKDIYEFFFENDPIVIEEVQI